MTNYKTTIAGILAAIALALQPFFSSTSQPFELSKSWPQLLGAALIAALGCLAKDHDVTGGTPSTPATRQ